MSTASQETGLPVAGIPSRSPCWVALTTRRMTTRSLLATMSCSTAFRSGRAPMKVRSSPVTFSAPLIVPSEPPCHVICGVKYSVASSGWCSLKTRATKSRAIATFASVLDASLISFPFSRRRSHSNSAIDRPRLASVDRLRDPLGDHDRGGVQRDRYNDRHDRCVDDTKSVDPLDGAMRVHDRPLVLGTAHRRRRGRVPVGSQVRGDHVCEPVVPDCVTGKDLELEEPSERRITADLARQPH